MSNQSMYSAFVSRILFPLHERLKGHDTVEVRRRMEKSQWWSKEQLTRLRVDRLRELLVDIGRNVPYYRRLFLEYGFSPENLSSLEDLQRLPFLTKPLIRTNCDALKTESRHHLARFNTGGSSGEPLIFYIGKERVSHDVAAKWRATRWWDVDIGDPEIVVWGSPIELGAQDRVRQWRDSAFRTTLLPAFAMSEQNLDDFVRKIRSWRPKMLFGYPSALSHIARHAENRGIAVDDLGVKVAFVTSERLYPDQREAIGRIFNCQVANGYGARDAGFIAHECQAGGMHITAEDVIVEIVDENGKVQAEGSAGELVITHLATREFPFVRYRTGDIGVLSSETCACGRGLPLLKEIQGRSTDFVIASNGTVMHGLSLIYVLRDLPGVQSFKIIQESRRLTRVLLVRGPEFSNTAIPRAIDGIKKRLGEDVQVDVELVDNIPPERSGKHRYVISHADTALNP